MIVITFDILHEAPFNILVSVLHFDSHLGCVIIKMRKEAAHNSTSLQKTVLSV